MRQERASLTRAQRAALCAAGLGYSPIAPGTLTSAAVAGLLLGLALSSPILFLAVALALALLGSLFTVRYGGAARAPDGGTDPGWVVSDEVAGQALACLGVLPALGEPGEPHRLLLAFAGAFLLFRLLDILKPWPIAPLESVRGGWGVLLDDVAAGLVAALLVVLACAVST